MSFYYTLQSNASLQAYPNNKPHDFKVMLSRPLELTGRWSVGLAEIHFPMVFEYPLDCLLKETANSKKKFSTTINVTSKDMAFVTGEMQRKDLTGYKYLCERMNSTNLFPITDNAQKRKSPIEMRSNSAESRADDVVLDSMMGTFAITGDGKIVSAASQTPKICNYTPQYLYVYCTIVNNQPVGDEFAPLLRLVEVPSPEWNESKCTREWNKPQYKPLANNQLAEIGIVIHDERGRTVPFSSNTPLVATLHFKKLQ
jgi:hypothetical protein